MREPNFDKIEIVEPPIQELVQRHHPWRRVLGIGCGGFIIVLVGFFVSIKIALGPGPKTMRTVPEDFPSSIPLYNKENIESVTVIPGQYKSRAVQIVAIVPKTVLAPLFIDTEHANGALPAKNENKNIFKKFWEFLTTPIVNANDSIEVEWRDMEAGPSFVYNYYRDGLLKQKYVLVSESKDKARSELSFMSPTGAISGSLLVDAYGDAKQSGTAYVLLLVSRPKGTASSTP